MLINGGAGGIRTLDRALQPYNGLANRRLQPLGHSSVRADMPDAGASRKRQIRVALRSFGDIDASGAVRKPIRPAAELFCSCSCKVASYLGPLAIERPSPGDAKIRRC